MTHKNNQRSLSGSPETLLYTMVATSLPGFIKIIILLRLHISHKHMQVYVLHEHALALLFIFLRPNHNNNYSYCTYGYTYILYWIIVDEGMRLASMLLFSWTVFTSYHLLPGWLERAVVVDFWNCLLFWICFAVLCLDFCSILNSSLDSHGQPSQSDRPCGGNLSIR